MEYKTGDRYTKSFKVDSDTVELFAKVSQDNNPVHLDEEYAKTTIFKTRIAHGMLVAGFISSVLGNDFPGNGTIYVKQEMSFKRPVYLNDTVDIVIEITGVQDNGWLNLSTNCYVGGKMVVEGAALVIPPSTM